jgi:glycosyltransferase involved in cell wall biosynthesis
MNLESEYAQPLANQVRDLGLDARIKFLGFRDDFTSILSGSDIFLHTPQKDPHPIAVLGAMASRLPVVAFAVDGVQEQVVHGQTGFLVPFGDNSGLVSALRNCLDDPELRSRMGQKGYVRVQQLFTAEVMVQKISQIINSLLPGSVRA